MQQMPLAKNFGVNLAAACESLGISQQELADRSGIHYVTINRIFHGKLNPKLSTCERLAKAAGVRADVLFLEPIKVDVAVN